MDLSYPAYDSACQPHLYTVRMSWRFCQNILYNAFGQSPGALVLFLYDFYPDTGIYILSVSSVHRYIFFMMSGQETVQLVGKGLAVFPAERRGAAGN